MKQLLSITLAICSLAAPAWAQGTFQFTAHLDGASVLPPDETAGTAIGDFDLNGSMLTYWVREDDFVFFARQATINGPAASGSNGPVIFDLGEPEIMPPLDGLPGGFHFSGTIALTSQQVFQLQSALWYVTIRDDTDARIRGQVLLVPEPSTVTLAGLGALWLFSRFRKAQKFAGRLQWFPSLSLAFNSAGRTRLFAKIACSIRPAGSGRGRRQIHSRL